MNAHYHFQLDMQYSCVYVCMSMCVPGCMFDAPAPGKNENCQYLLTWHSLNVSPQCLQAMAPEESVHKSCWESHGYSAP